MLGVDEAFAELERQAAGGMMAPAQPVTAPNPTQRPIAPAPGDGSGLRSVPEVPPGSDSQPKDVSLPPSRAEVIDAAIERLVLECAD